MKPHPAIVTNVNVSGVRITHRAPRFQIPRAPYSRICVGLANPFQMLWLFALFCIPISGTTSIAIRLSDPAQVIIGTDSSAVDSSGKRLPQRVCKIRKSGGWYFLLRGLVEDTASHFNASERATAALKGARTIAEASQRLRRSLEDGLRPSLEQKRLVNLEEFRMEGLRMAPLGAVVVGVVVGIPQMFDLRCMVVSRLDEPVRVSSEIHVCPGADCASGIAVVTVPGEDKAIFRWDSDPITATRKFLQFEIDRNIPEYAAPISILVIDHAGAKWIERGMCAAIMSK